MRTRASIDVSASPEVVWELPEEFQTLGFAPGYRGHAGLVEGLEQFAEAFEFWEIRPARALDFGNRVLALGSFRGKLGVEKTAPVGFSDIRLRFELDTDADDEQLATLLKLTERYCVVLQTLRTAPPTRATLTT